MSRIIEVPVFALVDQHGTLVAVHFTKSAAIAGSVKGDYPVPAVLSFRKENIKIIKYTEAAK